MKHSITLGLATIALATSASNNAAASIPSGRSRFEARLTNVHGTVDVVSPRQHVATADEVLVEGQRARVRESSTATLSMRGGAVLTASELTELHLYRRSPVLLRLGRPAPRETAIRRGVVTVSLAANARALPLVTPSCAITALAGSEALVRVGANGTRLTVTRGAVRVRADGQMLTVRANQAARIDPQHAPRRRLLVQADAPRAPRARIFSLSAETDVAFTWSERVQSSATTWRVQVSRSATFAAVDTDATGVTARTFTARGLHAGTYFVRVRGTDADGFEGPWSNAGRVTVTVPRVHPARDERLARLELPPGSRCGLDTSPIALVIGSLELSPDRDHVLRCVHSEGGEPSTLTIPASECGPLRHAVYSTLDAASGTQAITLRLTDNRGTGVPYANVRVEAPAGVTAGAFREGAERGMYEGSVQWPSSVPRAPLQFIVNGSVRFEDALER
jgi:hypothetical protein